MKKHLYLLILTTCIISCGKAKEAKTEDSKKEASLAYMKIDPPDMSSLQPLRMSEFVDSVEYVQLETTDDCLLRFILSASHVEDFFLIYDGSTIYKFDAITGKFLHKIGRQGQGPGEYAQQLESFCVDDSKRIILKPHIIRSMMAFDYNGKFLNNIEFDNSDDSIFTELYDLSILEMDSKYMVFQASLMTAEDARQPNDVIVYDYINKKIMHTIPNRLGGKYERHSNRFGGIKTAKDGDNIFYKSFYNDTLYAIHKENGITPCAVIDFGKYKVTDETFLSRDFMSDISGKLLINHLYLNNNFIFFHIFSWGYTYDFICKYDRNTGKLTYHSSHMINDIDGGANLYLDGLSRGIGNVISEYDITESENKKLFFLTLDKSELKYPELREKFERIHEKRDSEDNPLLMILHKKGE